MCCGASPYLPCKGVIDINNKEFMKFAEMIERHLAKEKVFIKNTARCAEVEYAMELANKLFPEAKVTLEHDALQTGALIIVIKDFDLTVRGATEINLFMQMVANASNFEIYAEDEESAVIAILFSGALIKVN